MTTSKNHNQKNIFLNTYATNEYSKKMLIKIELKRKMMK